MVLPAGVRLPTLRRAVKGGTRWIASMTDTLEKLDALSRSEG